MNAMRKKNQRKVKELDPGNIFYIRETGSNWEIWSLFGLKRGGEDTRGDRKRIGGCFDGG